jgi:hypothetical protein
MLRPMDHVSDVAAMGVNQPAVLLTAAQNRCAPALQREALLAALYGVRVSRIGALRVPFGTTMTV